MSASVSPESSLRADINSNRRGFPVGAGHSHTVTPQPLKQRRHPTTPERCVTGQKHTFAGDRSAEETGTQAKASPR